jgi:hypothetical protein
MESRMRVRLFSLRNLRRSLPWLAIPAFGLAFQFAWVLWASRGSETAIGTYMMDGGRGYIVVGSRSFGRLAVQEASRIATIVHYPILNHAWAAQFRNGHLILLQSDRLDTGSDPWYARPELRIHLQMSLVPSSSLPQDWDLVEARAVDSAPGVFQVSFWVQVFRSGSFKDGLAYVVAGVRGDPYILDLKLDASMPAVHSFLHRVDDPRLVEYFRNRYSEDPTTATLSLVRSLSEDHPEDPYLALHRIDVEAAAGNSIEAARLMDRWDARNAMKPEVLLAESARIARLAVAMAENRRLAPNLASIRDAFPDPGSSPPSALAPPPRSLTWKMEWFRTIGRLSGLWIDTATVGLMPPSVRPKAGPERGAVSGLRPSFTDIRIGARAAHEISMFRLLQGRRDEALEILAGAYRLGQSMNASGPVIDRMIGMAVQEIALEGLTIYGLNGCETVREVEGFWDTLERLDKSPGQEEEGHYVLGDGSFLMTTMKDATGGAFTLTNTSKFNLRIEDKFHLLRAATAVRHRFLRTGAFPRSKEEFDLLGPEGLAEDDAETTRTIGFRLLENGDLRLYGAFTDLTVPRERKYPFPREGVRATDAADLLRQFPNGLPRDPYDGSCLRILDSTTTQPVIVFAGQSDLIPKGTTPRSDLGSSVPKDQHVFNRSVSPVSASAPPELHIEIPK